MGQTKSKSAATKRYIAQAIKLLENTVVTNDVTMLAQFLADNTIFSTEDLDDSELLHKAAFQGHLGCLRILLDHGVNPNKPDENNGMTPLHYCAMSSRDTAIKCLHLLAHHGANLDYLGTEQCRKGPLHIAIEFGHTNFVEEAVALGCNVDLVSECEKGMSPLILAIKENNVSIVDILLKGGADIHKSWCWKSTPTTGIDIITHAMENDEKYNSMHSQIFSLLLHADNNLIMTLRHMPQGQKATAGSVSVYRALMTVLQRIQMNYSFEAQNLVMTLVTSGYKPSTEVMTFLKKFDVALYRLVKTYLRKPSPLQDICTRALRTRFKKNVLFGVEKFGLIAKEVKDQICMVNPPQPCLIEL